MAHEIFISYSSKNKLTADAICHVLEQNKITCWIAPRDIPIGSKYTKVITKAIEDCKLLIVVFSRDVISSEWVDSEISTAISKGKTILSYKIDQTPYVDGYELMLQNRHWIEAYPKPEEKFHLLVEDILNLLGKDRQSPDICNEIKQSAIPKKKFWNRAFSRNIGSAKNSELPQSMQKKCPDRFCWNHLLLSIDIAICLVFAFFLLKEFVSIFDFKSGLLSYFIFCSLSLASIYTLFLRCNLSMLMYKKESKGLLLSIVLFMLMIGLSILSHNGVVHETDFKPFISIDYVLKRIIQFFRIPFYYEMIDAAEPVVSAWMVILPLGYYLFRFIGEYTDNNNYKTSQIFGFSVLKTTFPSQNATCIVLLFSIICLSMIIGLGTSWIAAFAVGTLFSLSTTILSLLLFWNISFANYQKLIKRRFFWAGSAGIVTAYILLYLNPGIRFLYISIAVLFLFVIPAVIKYLCTKRTTKILNLIKVLLVFVISTIMIPSLLFGFNIFMLDGTKPTGSLWVACEKYYYIKHNNRLTGLASRYRKVLPPIYLQIQPLKSGYLLINGFYKDFAEKDSLYFKDQNELNCFYWGVYSIPADKEIIPTKYYDIKFFTTNDGNFFHLYKNRYLDDSAGYDYEGVCYQDSYSDTIRYIIPISDKIHSIRYDKVNNEFTGLDTRDKKYQYNLEGDRLLLKQDTANVQHLE